MPPWNRRSHDGGAYRFRPDGRSIFAGCCRGFRLVWLSSVALTALVPAAPAGAQTISEATTPTDNGVLPTGPSSASSALSPPTGLQPRTGTGVLPYQGPEFQAGATVNFSESYVTNADGLPGGSQADEISSPALSAYLHEHSRSLTVDATYAGTADFYAQGTLPTQINNDLQAVGNLDILPGELTLGAKAFAQPVQTSSFGTVTADNRSVPNGYSNSYGYTASPDLKLNLGNFATSETAPDFGQAFFTNPPGSTVNVLSIAGAGNPQNTTVRGVTQTFSSGSDFDRFNWYAVGAFNETASGQDLLSEKSGVANLVYAFSYEFFLIGTGGYDGVTSSTPLGQNVSGPIGMGGFGVTFGKNFFFEAEAGEKYNSPSYTGTLRWNISPRALLSGSLNDYIQTPEGQLLNNLTSLTALPNGSLGSPSSVLGNGSLASLSSNNIQSQDNLALDQTITRYQTGVLAFQADVERNHASISVSGTRSTILGGVFVGAIKDFTWTAQAQYFRDLTPLLKGGLTASYGKDEEFGNAQTYQIQGQLSYQLSRLTSIYFNADYLTRSSTTYLQALTPFAGKTNDVQVTIGFSHKL